jgi:hypothetical protein
MESSLSRQVPKSIASTAAATILADGNTGASKPFIITVGPSERHCLDPVASFSKLVIRVESQPSSALSWSKLRSRLIPRNVTVRASVANATHSRTASDKRQNASTSRGTKHYSEATASNLVCMTSIVPHDLPTHHATGHARRCGTILQHRQWFIDPACRASSNIGRLADRPS